MSRRTVVSYWTVVETDDGTWRILTDDVADPESAPWTLWPLHNDDVASIRLDLAETVVQVASSDLLDDADLEPALAAMR